MTQIQTKHKLLIDEWYGSIKTILLKGIKKRDVPNASTKPRAAKQFMASLAAVMNDNLADIAARSLLIYTEFVCDKVCINICQSMIYELSLIRLTEKVLSGSR